MNHRNGLTTIRKVGDNYRFNVAGSTPLEISFSPNVATAGVIGFSINTHPDPKGNRYDDDVYLYGGVMSREDAILMAQHILQTVKNEKLLTYDELMGEDDG